MKIKSKVNLNDLDVYVRSVSGPSYIAVITHKGKVVASENLNGTGLSLLSFLLQYLESNDDGEIPPSDGKLKNQYDLRLLDAYAVSSAGTVVGEIWFDGAKLYSETIGSKDRLIPWVLEWLEG